MSNDFFNASGGGDPVWFQHLAWFFGHPETWLTVFVWVLLLRNIIKVSLRLWQAGKRRGLALFLAGVGAVLFIYVRILRASFTGYVEGNIDEIVSVQTANSLLIMCVLLSTIWLVVDKRRKKRTS